MMATVDNPRRALLRAVRPCAEVEDIVLIEAGCTARWNVKWKQGAMLTQNQSKVSRGAGTRLLKDMCSGRYTLLGFENLWD